MGTRAGDVGGCEVQHGRGMGAVWVQTSLQEAGSMLEIEVDDVG